MAEEERCSIPELKRKQIMIVKENSNWSKLLCCCIGRKKCLCRCGMVRVDAEDYYSKQLQSHKMTLIQQMKFTLRNVGCAIVVFRSSALAFELINEDSKKVVKTFEFTPEEQN